MVSTPQATSTSTTQQPQSPPSDNENDDQPLLVTEFPPPPYYFRHAATTLTPPAIPTEALQRASQRAAAQLQRAKEESEQIRLAAEADGEEGDNAGAGKGSADATVGGGTTGNEGGVPTKGMEEKEDLDDWKDSVAVFGEYVEDPLLAPVEDLCQDPTEIQAQVKKLNHQILRGFVKLVEELVNRPLEHKKVRDELSHTIFLMLQECNKFREHQAREILIETLEGQLKERRAALQELQEEIASTDEALRTLDGM